MRYVARHFPWPERRGPSVAPDLSEGVSPGAVAFDRENLDELTVIGVVGRKQARCFAHPSFAGEYVSVHPPATKAIPQRRKYRSLCATIRPMRRNEESLSVAYTLESKIDLSCVLELGADAMQHVLEVLVEREVFNIANFFLEVDSPFGARDGWT